MCDGLRSLFGPSDRPLEKYLAPTFAPTGELLLAYNKTEIMTETVVFYPSLTVEGVTTFGQTDLYVPREMLDFDLSQNVYLPLIVK